MFKFLWSSSSTTNKNNGEPSKKNKKTPFSIPDYEQGSKEDSIDLQIKSLTYMFRRYRIHLFAHFLKNTEMGKYEFDWFNHSNGNTSNTEFISNDKLDLIYNREKFQQVILNDPYRILIDYSKNKFRSMLILSEEPSIDMRDAIPEFPFENFKFIVLKPDSSINEYIDALVNKSFIYCEHKVANSIKVEILKGILVKYYKKPSSKITKDDRSLIIQSYVQQLAFYIQVDRIHKATLKSKESLITTTTNTSTSTTTPKKHHKNPTTLNDISNINNNITVTAAPHLRPKSSTTNLRPTSPMLRSRRDSNDAINQNNYPRLRSSKSIAQLKQQVPQSGLTTTTTTIATPLSKSPMRTLREKPSMAILKMDRVYESTTKKRHHGNDFAIAEEADNYNSDAEDFSISSSSSSSSDDDSFGEDDDGDHSYSLLSGFESNSDYSHGASGNLDRKSQQQQQQHSSTIVQSLSLDEKSLFYEQSKSAVSIRIEREKQILLVNKK